MEHNRISMIGYVRLNSNCPNKVVQNFGIDGKHSLIINYSNKFQFARYECMRVPESLPRWLKCVKWSNRDDVLEVE